MKKLALVSVFALLAAPTVAAAAPVPQFPSVDDSSIVEPDGDRVIRLTTEVPATPAQVWDALTTAEGWRSFASPVAYVDFRVDGLIETSYDPAARQGSRDTIHNRIVAYAPERLLVLRNTQAPPAFENAAEFAQTSTIIALEPSGQGTRVTLTAAGFRPGPAFDDLYGKFVWGDAFTLDALRKRFADGPTDWSRPAQVDKDNVTKKP